jgi:hypothetical protein
LARSGHPGTLSQCPLLGVKRTWMRLDCPPMAQSGHRRAKVSAGQIDPEPRFAGRKRLM